MKLLSRFYMALNRVLGGATGFVLCPVVRADALAHPVDLIIDVGVASGTPDVYGLAPDAPLLLVEPQAEYWPACEAILRGKRGLLFKSAAGAYDGEAELFAFGLSSSLLTRTDKDITGTKIPTTIKRLDTMLRDCALWHRAQSCLLKIDTEGYELEVLRGAAESLESRKIRYIVVEGRVHGVETYDFAQLVAYLHGCGYKFLDVREVGYGRHRINYLDCIFELTSP